MGWFRTEICDALFDQTVPNSSRVSYDATLCTPLLVVQATEKFRATTLELEEMVMPSPPPATSTCSSTRSSDDATATPAGAADWNRTFFSATPLALSNPMPAPEKTLPGSLVLPWTTIGSATVPLSRYPTVADEPPA